MGMYGGKSSRVNTLTALQNRSGFKQSIILCDFKPGTRNITLQPGAYRVAVVGGGGGSSNVAGNAQGGTSSFGTGPIIQATGGAARSLGGVGTLGDVNTSGSSTQLATSSTGGGASGHRLGSGPDVPASPLSFAGCGWSSLPIGFIGGMSAVDGFGLGIDPGTPMRESVDSTDSGRTSGLYGHGGSIHGSSPIIQFMPGIGGGGSNVDYPASQGGIGGGGAGSAASDYPGSGGGYSEKIITVTASTTYSYTVGDGGLQSGKNKGGVGCVIVERLA